MTSLRILLLVTGGIAAYKSCFLARLLVQAGFSVKVAMTDAATHFVTPMTFQVLTGHPVATDLWGERQSEALDHIEYARWADMAVVAPATANCLGKLAGGIADDIVSTLLLAWPGPLLMAPAMNDNMWRHPAVQANCRLLAERGVAFVGPAAGFLACGTTSEGRMSEPEDIKNAIVNLAGELNLPTAEDRPLESADQMGEKAVADFWRGRALTITAGPTYEAIDPVRFLGNRSSGAFGFALASAAANLGAQVTLIAGPTDLAVPRGMAHVVRTESAEQMAEAVAQTLTDGTQWLIMSAAVADFAPADVSTGKIKKEDLGQEWVLRLKRNPDILKDVVPEHRQPDLKVVGFALETSDVTGRAQAKLEAKGLHYIVANDPTAAGSGFGSVNHRISLLGRQGLIWQSESLPKSDLAWEILSRLSAAESSSTT